ncbi:PAS sensor protein [Natrinema pellirubrum DSM 15624]|uniref:histidine kinase n=1 Tax=Natrinema pellirubrum (strain DSM 15624 / CIP 106293 / JCM 10476 / NCIMB 786 / 157) TaxID=797303 RepID=L0JPX2_NATP1|nr:PAS domain S-box protein [Natrinema pellirubrum]AGB32421.1 PAS domain S-box [Natrinema pellirubrum DSM 15624]ELY73910.1 PAS sensor protein [Natrinema pellirubrum DSM 15624]
MTERVEPAGSPPWDEGDSRAARQWYRTLVETVDDGVIQLDADDRIVAVDDDLLELTGYTREALRGEHVSWLLEGADALAADDAPFEFPVRTADGTTVACSVRLGTVPAADGSRGSIALVGELDAASEAPSATAGPPSTFEPITAVLEEADVGVFVLDDEFDIVWINDATERYFGLDAATVVGRDKMTVIDDVISDRIAEPAGFADIIGATYDDNSDAERFECRVTSDDGREERWLEHRSKPIRSGPYAGGRLELYYDVTDRHRRAYQLRRLNEAVREWLATGTRRAVAEQACRHLADILALEVNGVFLHEPADETLEPVAWTDAAESLFGEPPTFEAGEGIAWQVFETGEPLIYDDVTADEAVYNPETPIHSEICLPIGDHGIVIIGAEERAAFDAADLSLAKIVASSLEATFDRISHEQHLERERVQTETLLRTMPVAVSVEDAEGETVLANRHAQTALGLADHEPLGETELLAERTVVDADGEPIGPDHGPSARVRDTGEPVRDVELAIEADSGERTWFSITAVPVFGPDGDVERVVSAGEDITALKEQKRRLQRRKHELESELSEILGRVSDAFYALDDEWCFTHVNDRAAELLGRSRDELLGRNIWEVFPSGTRSDLADRYREAMATQEPVSWERYSESLEVWMEIQAYPSETGLSVYFRDVSERKRRERQLEQYERIIETVEDGIYVLDAEGRFTMVNDAYVELTGYDREELLGSHASMVVDEHVMALAREIAADESGEPTVEADLRTKSGERRSIEAAVTSVTSADRGRERIGVVRDVTERKARQRRLEESEQRYRTLAENFPNGVVALFDEDLRYTAAGGSLLGEVGIDQEVVVGQTIHERYADDLLPEVEPHFRAALEGEQRSFEIGYCGRELRATTLPVRTGGTVTSGMLVIQDVTERTEYQRKLEESNERLEQFAYAASHDLQEPLRMISSYLRLLEGRYADDLDADGQEFIDYAVDGAERLSEMINGLLEYSRIETRGDPLEPLSLADVVADVLEDLQFRIEEEDATVTVEPLPVVRGDAGQLRQVFQNLLTNALEYSGDEPPEIHVSAERTGDRWAISVRDEGIGIDPEHQDRIFRVFQRLHSHEDHPGTGIGLALCHRIIERHGGQITVDSEPGEGATFTVTLPAADGSAE